MFFMVCVFINNNRTRHYPVEFHNFVLALTGIQTRDHCSGSKALNDNRVRNVLVCELVTVLSFNWYEGLRAVNRHLLCKYILI